MVEHGVDCDCVTNEGQQMIIMCLTLLDEYGARIMNGGDELVREIAPLWEGSAEPEEAARIMTREINKLADSWGGMNEMQRDFVRRLAKRGDSDAIAVTTVGERAWKIREGVET